MTTFWSNSRWLRRLMMWVLLPVAVIYLWWQWMYPVAQFRYRLTVEVMTPDGLKSGSSVIEVRYSSGHPLPNPGRAYNDRVVAAEAVYVDLGRGKNLFVLLGTRRAPVNDGYYGDWEYTNTGFSSGKYNGPTNGPHGVLNLPNQIFQTRRTAGEEWKIREKIAEQKGKPPVLVNDFGLLPTFATFADLEQPNSVRVVKPGSLETDIGAGYRLDQVTLQVTNEAPTENIISVLPWLAEMRRPDAAMETRGDWPFIDNLGYASFKMPP